MATVIPVQIRRLPHSAGLDLPAYQTEHAAGMDLHAAITSDLEIPPGGVVLVPCGFQMALPDGYEAQIRPRSGLAAKHGITVVNTPGTIDSDYRGEVKVALVNHGRQIFRVERGMRVAQMLIQPVYRARWIEVAELDETSRGAGGFGHTGT